MDKTKEEKLYVEAIRDAYILFISGAAKYKIGGLVMER